MKLFRKAVLIIHGFAGGVYDEEYLNHQLELVSKFDVYTFTLPGHDGIYPRSLTYKDWIKKSEEEIEFLINNGYKKIYIIGHSMGGVLATYLASKYKEVKKLVLLAPAFRYIANEDGEFKAFKALKTVPKLVEQYGIKMLTSRMTKLPLSATSEFMKLVKENELVMEKVYIPTLIFQGNSDNVVPKTTPEYILSHLPAKRKKVIYLENTTHDILRESKKEYVSKKIIKFLK